jgi:hypothetical protein
MKNPPKGCANHVIKKKQDFLAYLKARLVQIIVRLAHADFSFTKLVDSSNVPLRGIYTCYTKL